MYVCRSKGAYISTEAAHDTIVQILDSFLRVLGDDVFNKTDVNLIIEHVICIYVG